MAGKRAISEIAGRARFADQSGGAAYRALRPVRCASCDEVIAEGELFTRHSVFEQGVPILPKCQKCIPFTVRAEDERTRHPMLDSLLSTAAGKPSVKESKSGEQIDQEQARIREAVERRLGPALSRCRRHKA